MPSKIFKLDEQLSVTVYKRKGNRNVRLTVAAGGKVRVSIPAWAPYLVGVQFAQSRKAWIAQQVKPMGLLHNGQAIGKAHRLMFTPKPIAKAASRVYDTHIVVSYPESLQFDMPDVQNLAQAASIRALRSQAEKLLPQRLETLAKKHGFKYKSVSIKQLRGRWGSCDHDTNIVLNLYLMQLSWEHIDYVLVHELVHTRVLRHGPVFWQEMEKVMPDAKLRRKAFKQFQPILA